jgi:hypothetical protein
MTRRRAQTAIAVLVLTLAATTLAPARIHDPRITSDPPLGAGDATFPRLMQEQASMAVDQGALARPGGEIPVLAVGAHDLEDEACVALSPCTLAKGVGLSAIYLSFDGGMTWHRPTYTGATARQDSNGRPIVGPIHTLPGFYEQGLVSHGDPSLAFGPRPVDGRFAWDNGSRLYYLTVARGIEDTPSDVGRPSTPQQLELARTDDPTAAANDDASAWLPFPDDPLFRPESAAQFRYQPSIWVDDAQTSPYFGHAYMCWTFLRHPLHAHPVFPRYGSPNALKFAYSVDGGDSWVGPHRLSTNITRKDSAGRQGCSIRTDSQGTVYVAWEEYLASGFVEELAVSHDGGVSFRHQAVAQIVAEAGANDGSQGRNTFDGLAGAPATSAPTIDVANGAPWGRPPGGAADRLYMAWVTGPIERERLLVQWSDDGGADWIGPYDATRTRGRPALPAIAVAPDGSHLYIASDSFLDPWQAEVVGDQVPRRVVSVTQDVDVAALERDGSNAPWEVLKGVPGDARAASYLGLGSELFGDRNGAVATDDNGWTAINDVRNAAKCRAVDVARQQGVIPPGLMCGRRFGSTDLYGSVVTP